MRLLLSALSRLLNPTRRTRGLQRRPYFVEAKALHDLVAGAYQASPPPPARWGRRAAAGAAVPPAGASAARALNGHEAHPAAQSAASDSTPKASDGNP